MNVKRLRELRGWNQEELAFHMGVSQATVSQIENTGDGVTLRQFKRAAEVLGVPLAALFSEDRQDKESLILEVWRRLDARRQQDWLEMAQALARRSESTGQ